MWKELVLSLLLIFSFAGIANGATIPLYSCSALTSGNTYILQNNLSTGISPCFTIPTDTTVNLNGFTITTNFCAFIGDVTLRTVVINDTNVIIKNGFIQTNGGCSVRIGESIYVNPIPNATGILIQNVTASSQVVNGGGLSYSNFGVYSNSRISIRDSQFFAFADGGIPTTHYAGYFINGTDYSDIRNTFFNATDYDIYLTSDNNYIQSCFEPIRIFNSGTNNTIIRTCPAPLFPFCGDFICNGDETIVTCPTDCSQNITYPPTQQNVGTFYNKWVIFMVMILCVSMAFSIWIGGDHAWVVFVTISATLTFMASLMGVFPTWILILSLIVIAGLFTKVVMSLFKQ